jgi:hypothetical protein
MWPKYGVFHPFPLRLTPLNCLRRWPLPGSTAVLAPAVVPALPQGLAGAPVPAPIHHLVLL